MQFAWMRAVGRDILIPSEKPIIAESLCGEERDGVRERGREGHVQSDRRVRVKLHQGPTGEAVDDMIIDF